MQCEIAIVVYDVNDKYSLREANHCITTIKDNIKEHPVEFMLVGNKVAIAIVFKSSTDFSVVNVWHVTTTLTVQTSPHNLCNNGVLLHMCNEKILQANFTIYK